MIWKMTNGRPAPQDVVAVIEEACAKDGIPAGMVCAMVERECSFKNLTTPNSAGAVGYLQIKQKFATDYYRYAGYQFSLLGFDGLRGCIAALKTYAAWARKAGYTGDDVWRYVVCVHRYGQRAPETRTPRTAARVRNVETMMRYNGMWYDTAPATTLAPTAAPAPAVEPVATASAAVSGAVRTYNLARQGAVLLSKNFTVREFACKDGSDAIKIAPGLIEILQKIRDHFGRPVTIVSGYRSPAYNLKIKGAKASKHMTGEAADIQVRGIPVRDVALYAESIGAGAVGAYLYGFTHVDCRSGKLVRWYRKAKAGKDVYVSTLQGQI